MGLFSGSRPRNIGLHDGRLAPAPRTPNGVSSQTDPATDAAHYIAPLDCHGDPERWWQRLVAALRGTERVAIVTQADHYLHAECSSKTLGFVDDLECLLDSKAGVIHVRSAARLGRRDFGVNRARVEALRERLEGR